MTELTRRELLKVSLAVAPAAAIAGRAAAHPLPPIPQGVAPASVDAAVAPGPRERLLFDFGWRFHLGHASDPARDFGFGLHQRTYAKAGAGTADAARLDFDDADWTPVDLPHDWGVTLPFVQPEASKALAPEAEDPAAAHGYKPLGREFPDTSVGWYRRVFDVAGSDLGRRFHLELEGVFRDCLVFCNGHIVARNDSGYAGFVVDLTDVLDYGRRNVIAVRADATLGEGWFYEGAGVYRHVWLHKLDPLNVPAGGVYVRSEVRDGKALVRIGTEVRNDGDGARRCEIISIVLAPDGRELARPEAVAVSVAPGVTATVEQQVELARPALWSIETPHLHRVRSEVRDEGAVRDALESSFGIRTVAFDPAKGFFLNGRPLKLQGTCNHHDHASVGTAIPDALHEWRVARLKHLGANAWRSAHNPPTPALLDACDRLGMLVIAETRQMASSEDGLSQLERMIRRDRNHACVMLWSLGNEEPQMASERGARIVRSMKRLANLLDPSRLCTFAMDKGFGLGVWHEVDVVGFNYRIDQMDAVHA